MGASIQKNRKRLDYVRNWLEKLKWLLGRGRCVICGDKDELEFAHLKPTKLKGESRGQERRMLDVKKNLNSYTLLCKYCHHLFDNDYRLS